MTNKFEVGEIIEGKVTGIQSYGAFVALDDETEGLVHISEIKHGFVKDINDHLKVNDQVKVKVLKIDSENNKISLSIRATKKKEDKQRRPRGKQVEKSDNTFKMNTLEGKLEKWINQSEERQKLFKGN